jgi:hypothetical protein
LQDHVIEQLEEGLCFSGDSRKYSGGGPPSGFRGCPNTFLGSIAGDTTNPGDREVKKSIMDYFVSSP